MNRTSFLTRLIFPALVGILPACGGDPVCKVEQNACGTVCANLMSDPNNCGLCGHACGSSTTCVIGECKPIAACMPPEIDCGVTCVDTQISTANCGNCGAACGTNAECITGKCAGPLAVMQTTQQVPDGKGGFRTTGRDVFVLQDVSFALAKLNTSTFPGDRVVDHKILPDGSLIVVAAETTEGVFELYHVSARGVVTKLNPQLPKGGNVQPGVAVSRDGSTLVYRADQDNDEIIDLYAVTLANPIVTMKVNDPLTGGGNVSRVFTITADGKKVAYIADQDTDGLDEAYFVDLAIPPPISAGSGGPPPRTQKLNPPNIPTSIFDLAMTSDGTKVVYRADHEIQGFAQLYEVDTANAGLASFIASPDGQFYIAQSYQLTPDDLAIIYTGGSGFLRDSLLRVPLVVPPLASERLVDGNSGFVQPEFSISPDSVRVYFRKRVFIDFNAFGTFGNIDKIFRVGIAEPGVLTLLSSGDFNFSAATLDFVVSRDEKHLVFRGGADGGEGGFNPQPGTIDPGPNNSLAPELYHVDLVTLAPPTLLTPPTISGHEGIGAGYVVTDDGRALYRADQEVVGSSDVYLTTFASPGTVTKVSPLLDATTDSNDVSFVSRF